MSTRASRAREAVLTAVFASLVFAATLVAFETPITRGYFNLGETMVYTAAMIGGPLVGLVAGGFGSMMADLTLGYAHYAPGTLAIKAIEGFITGVLYRRLRRQSPGRLRVISVTVGLAGALLLGVVGFEKYYGETILRIWGGEAKIVIPRVAWVLIALAFAAATTFLSIKAKPSVGARVLACLAGGVEMMTGYLLYEAYVLGFGLRVASAELPVNLGQAVIGAVVAVYVVEALERMGVRFAGEPGGSKERSPRV